MTVTRARAYVHAADRSGTHHRARAETTRDLEARAARNCRVVQLDYCVMAFEPGGDNEQCFTGDGDVFWDAVLFAARCLRGEQDPAALP